MYLRSTAAQLFGGVVSEQLVVDVLQRKEHVAQDEVSVSDTVPALEPGEKAGAREAAAAVAVAMAKMSGSGPA